MHSKAYYQEITCLADSDVNTGFLMGKAFAQLHLTLVNQKRPDGSSPIGFAFPQYRYGDNRASDGSAPGSSIQQSSPKTLPTIGAKIRCFGPSKESLQQCCFVEQLEHMSDYAHLTSIREIDFQSMGAGSYFRFQPRASKARMVRRQLRRHPDDADGIAERLDGVSDLACDLPYLNVGSHSSDHRYRLFIGYQPSSEKPSEWNFSTYGLSRTSTVPVF